MTSVERLAKLATPAAPRRGLRLNIADGDACVTNPEHGRMYTVRGTSRQYCPAQDHDMSDRLSRWPFLPHRDFVEAVETYKAVRR